MIWALFLLLQIKHFIVDFLLQRPYQYKNKGTYGHPGGILHAMLHAMTTWVIFINLGFIALGVVISLAEAVVHYHIDWLKVKTTKQTWAERREDCLAVKSDMYFHALGFDQLLHQLTYIGMVWLVV